MFIITAKGNLNVNDSFDWQKYNESTGGWVSLVFTGDATDNSQYGLRLENNYDKNANTYTSILWANGITEEEAEVMFREEEFIPKTYSAYDCTGKAFTAWHKLYQKPNGEWWCYHRVAFDI
jgi:hypothetical protein